MALYSPQKPLNHPLSSVPVSVAVKTDHHGALTNEATVQTEGSGSEATENDVVGAGLLPTSRCSCTMYLDPDYRADR